MSRPYEESLASRVKRLDVLIAQSEELFAGTKDDETRRNLAAEITRQQEQREQSISVLQRTRLLNRIAACALACFGISLALLVAIAIAMTLSNAGAFALLCWLVFVDLLLVIASAAVFIGTLFFRDVVARGHRPWRFQLRTIFWIMTVTAICLTLLALAFRE